jgi:hypothetical protein
VVERFVAAASVMDAERLVVERRFVTNRAIRRRILRADRASFRGRAVSGGAPA